MRDTNEFLKMRQKRRPEAKNEEKKQTIYTHDSRIQKYQTQHCTFEYYNSDKSTH